MTLKPGMLAPDFTAETPFHGSVSLDDWRGRPLLLKFYRFAGCPVCNLSLRNYVRQAAYVEAAGLQVAALFHSPVASLRAHLLVKEAVPFPLLADPDKKIFQRYEVTSSSKALRSLGALRHVVPALLAGYFPNADTVEGGLDGLPADFLLDEDGIIRLAHYGQHAGDSLSVEATLQALEQIQAPQRSVRGAK